MLRAAIRSQPEEWSIGKAGFWASPSGRACHWECLCNGGGPHLTVPQHITLRESYIIIVHGNPLPHHMKTLDSPHQTCWLKPPFPPLRHAFTKHSQRHTCNVYITFFISRLDRVCLCLHRFLSRPEIVLSKYTRAVKSISTPAFGLLRLEIWGY